MPRTAFGTVIKLILLSLIAVLLLNWFNVNPQNLLRDMVGNINPIMQWSINALDAAAPFTLLGAVTVLPIWAILLALRLLRQSN
ncbi:MAG: hypothetical protein OSB69_20350 [Alphaproteobacteria bacterium]|nr:hypothetical protein [Alphaproteobacteria bacterium]